MARAAARRSPTAPAARPGTWRACSKPRSAARRAPTPGHETDPTEEHRHAQPLPHGHAHGKEAEVAVGLAEELGEEAQHAIADQEHRRDLATRARFRREPPEQNEQRQAFAGKLVELRGVPRV